MESFNYQPNQDQILVLYKQENFFYKFLAQVLRTSFQGAKLYYTQPFTSDLFWAIKNSYKYKKSSLKNMDEFVCYRGSRISSDQLKRFKQIEGGFIQTLGFFSTSKNINIALGFANNVIYEITVKVKNVKRASHLDHGYADL